LREQDLGDIWETSCNKEAQFRDYEQCTTTVETSSGSLRCQNRKNSFTQICNDCKRDGLPYIIYPSSDSEKASNESEIDSEIEQNSTYDQCITIVGTSSGELRCENMKNFATQICDDCLQGRPFIMRPSPEPEKTQKRLKV
jgi:hypothetical protein